MPTEPPAQHRPPGIIDAVDLEYGLREVETDGDDAGHGRSFPLVDTIQPYPGSRRGWSMPSSGAVQRTRYMSLETIAPLGHDLSVSLPLIAA
jgi:hypothetical protein